MMVKTARYVLPAAILGWLIGNCGSKDDLAVERVAEVEHIQWMEWSKAVAPEVSSERRERWKRYWVPYAALPEEVKELDREWARKAIEAAKAR